MQSSFSLQLHSVVTCLLGGFGVVEIKLSKDVLFLVVIVVEN